MELAVFRMKRDFDLRDEELDLTVELSAPTLGFSPFTNNSSSVKGSSKRVKKHSRKH